MKFYVIVGLITVAAVFITMLSNLPEWVRILFSFPAISGLTSIVIQAWRDQRAQERAIELQNLQQNFTLGVASEMAGWAFKKHAEFAEAYAEKMNEILVKLFRDGPTEEAITYGNELRDLRKKFTVWLSKEIEDELVPFEGAIRDMGASAFLASLPDAGTGRSVWIERMFSKLSSVLSLNAYGVDIENEAASVVLDKLRNVLLISDLTSLRKNLISSAAGHLKNPQKNDKNT